MEKIILVGAGPLAENAIHILELLGSFQIHGLVDSGKKGEVMGYPILGDDNIIEELRGQVKNALVCIGNNEVRQKISNNLKKNGWNIPTIVHPQADIIKNVLLGDGCIVFSSVYLGPNVKLGNYTIIESLSVIGPGAEIGEAVLVTPLSYIKAGEKIDALTKVKK